LINCSKTYNKTKFIIKENKPNVNVEIGNVSKPSMDLIITLISHDTRPINK